MFKTLKVTATRVKYLDYGRMPLETGGCVPHKYPSDGVVIQVDHPAYSGIYITDDTLKALLELPAASLMDEGVMELDEWMEVEEA